LDSLGSAGDGAPGLAAGAGINIIASRAIDIVCPAATGRICRRNRC
jgi:hypothetical protein